MAAFMFHYRERPLIKYVPHGYFSLMYHALVLIPGHWWHHDAGCIFKNINGSLSATVLFLLWNVLLLGKQAKELSVTPMVSRQSFSHWHGRAVTDKTNGPICCLLLTATSKPKSQGSISAILHAGHPGGGDDGHVRVSWSPAPHRAHMPLARLGDLQRHVALLQLHPSQDLPPVAGV